MKISYIGGGVMAEAMIAGILQREIARPQDICIGEPAEARRTYLTQRHGVAVTADNLDAARRSDLVVLSVKPQTLSGVLNGLRDSLKSDQAVVSIVAGVKIQTIATGLHHEGIVRVMPNTPAQIGAGISVWLAAPPVNREHREATRSILCTLGEEMEVPEEKYLDMATALSGSGPAYVFLFIESLIDAGVHIGMSQEMARTLAMQTVLGGASLARGSKRQPAELREMVSSPGGTTVEALKVLEEGGFRTIIREAIVAAYEKSKRLGEQQK